MHEETRSMETLLRIAERISEVYHLPRDAALSALKASAFYPLLVDPQRNYLEEGAEKNFQRYQNEVEYGAWNRNEDGGIVE